MRVAADHGLCWYWTYECFAQRHAEITLPASSAGRTPAETKNSNFSREKQFLSDGSAMARGLWLGRLHEKRTLNRSRSGCRSCIIPRETRKQRVPAAGSSDCILWHCKDVNLADGTTMRRVISLFNDPGPQEGPPPVGLEDQREPIYFQHLMDYLHRQSDEASVPDSTEAEANTSVGGGDPDARNRSVAPIPTRGQAS